MKTGKHLLVTVWRIIAAAAGLGGTVGATAGLMVGVLTLPHPLSSGVAWFVRGGAVGAAVCALVGAAAGAAIRRRATGLDA